MNIEADLKKIMDSEKAISNALGGLKTGFEEKLNEVIKLYDTIKKHDPTFDVTALLIPFGIQAQTLKPATKPRTEKITVSIARVLNAKGVKEEDIILALPDKDKDKVIASLNNIKAKKVKGKRDSFIFKNGLFYPKL